MPLKVLRKLLRLPYDAAIDSRPIKSQQTIAASQAIVFRETAPSGVTFMVNPCRVIGAGDHAIHECISRALYVACFANAHVHGRSAIVDFERSALLDFQHEEFDRAGDRLELDLPVLQAGSNEVWMSTAHTADVTLDTAFNLLGPHTPQFGHWIWEYMPKYVAATMSSLVNGVPVLIDADMPKTHRQFLELVIPPGTEIIEVPFSATIEVKRLWCAPTLCYIPLRPRSVDPLWLIYATAPPDRFAAVMEEMQRRVRVALPAPRGPTRIFLARKPDQQRKIVNGASIEQHAREHGFVVVYPQDLDFGEQINLIRGAQYILGQAGSALFLNFFAQPGTKLCILSSQSIFRAASYICALEKLGLDVVLLTGPTVRQHQYVQFVDYAIPEEVFLSFLENWLA